MATINQVRTRIKALSVKEESYHAVVETKETITAIQKEQMYQGLDATGKSITPTYRRRKYAIAKASINPLPGFGVPDLKLTGAFYAGFKTDVTPDVFKTSSTDEKDAMLEKKYDPFGLDKDSKAEYIQILQPVLIKNVREKLML